MKPVIDSWKVIMTTSDGQQIELEDVPEDAAELIDERIKGDYEVSWGEGED